MSELDARKEVRVLAHELNVDEADLEFLVGVPSPDLRDLRELVSAAVIAHEEHRLRRVAALTGVLPAGITVKIARIAFGPVISARIAGLLRTDEAVRLARQMPPEFLTDVAVALDPARVEAIVRGLPQDLVVDVGTRLLVRGEHLVLGRFIAVVAVETALRVASSAAAADLLQIAAFCEDKSRLALLIDELDDNVLRDLISAAAEGGALEETLTLLDALPAPLRGRLVGQAADLSPTKRESLLAEIVAMGSWAQVLPALAYVRSDDLPLLVNAAALLDVEVIEQVVSTAREIDAANALVPAVMAMDDAHLQVVAASTLLRDHEVRDWLIETSGLPARLVRAGLDDLTAP